MKKEITYRVIRIIIVLLIFTIFTFCRFNVKESYTETLKMEDYLLNSLQVREISNVINRNNDVPNSDEIGSKNDGYRLEVSNSSFKEREVTFIVENTISKEESIEYKYIRYQILCDDKVITTSNLSEDGILYETKLLPGDKYIYEIKFWIDEDATNEVSGKQFSAKITLV